MVRGIGVVNLVHSAGDQKDFYPIDYRIYAPDQDGKTKNDHFTEIVINAIFAKKIKAKCILFDSWYAPAENLKLVHRLGLTFFTTLKSNRMVSLSKEGGWIHLNDIDWTVERMKNGVRVKLKEIPFKVQLFEVVATDCNIDWVITNCPDEALTMQVAQEANDVRWQVEDLHRGLKQLTGTEKCQYHKGRSQRNHIACCYYAWLFDKSFHVDETINQADVMAHLIQEGMSLGDMITLLKLRRGRYSLVEEKVPKGAKAIGVQIKDLGLPDSCVIAAIIRKGQVTLPRGTMAFKEFDEVLAVTDDDGAKRLAQLLEPPDRSLL